MVLKVTTKTSQESKPAGKPATKAKPKALSETQTLVNEYAHLAKKMEDLEVKAMQTRLEELKKRLQSIANETNLDKPVALTGTDGASVTFSACREETIITDRDKMIKLLTPKVFVEVGKVNLTDIKTYLTEGQILQFTEKQYGSRTLKAYTPAQ